MKSMFYLALLKSKEGEFTALSKLDSFTRERICPLFEISKVEYDSESKKKPKTLEEHLHGFCEKKFLKKWFSANSFIDTHLLDGSLVNGQTPMEYIYRQLITTVLMPVVPMPIAHLGDTQSYRAGLKSVIAAYEVKDIGIRLAIEDVMDIHLDKKLAGLLAELGKDYADCHLIFDLANSDYSACEEFSEGIVSLLESFPKFADWKSFTLCGGSFPRSDLLKKGSNTVVRLDWKLYRLVINGLAATSYSRPVNYGDYGIVSPGYFEFDRKKMKRSANIRYTAGENWLVIKGSALSKPGDNQQYVSQAGTIYLSGQFLGDNYSQGDRYLKNCHLGREKAGSPTVWNWVGQNHHFTKVVADLFASPAGS